MRMHEPALWICSLVSSAVVMAATVEAAVVTMRLSTGLRASSSGDGLPQAWAAPAKEPLAIDGRLDERAWEACPPVVLGKLERPGDTSPRSEVRFMHGRGMLYLGMKLTEPNIDKLKRSATTHDGPAWDDDSVELFLAPHANNEYYQIIASASGAIFDRYDLGNPAEWDSKAKAAVAVGKEGWSLEMAVPLASLGLGERTPERWRVNVYRNRRAGGKAESQAWSPTLSGDYNVPERFGYLLLTPQAPWAGREKADPTQHGIRVERLGEEEAVLQFDLSSLPKAARIYGAQLQCERRQIAGDDPRALESVEIYPLSAACQKGDAPRTAGAPLALVPPWFRSFDMTELVRGWVAGKPNYGLYVKKFPGWRVEKTYLDLCYEGETQDLPKQVDGVKALHRAGQTFLTWNEIDEPVGKDEVTWGQLKGVLDGLDAAGQVRYCVYRSEKPITAADVASAELLATVKPLSCWNTNGRNIERPIDAAIATKDYISCGQWNPFGSASADGDFGTDCPMDRLVIRDGAKPLDRGTGLYVHTPTAKRTAYYAVVTMVDGVANMMDLSAKNVTGAVEESPADPAPVLQKEMPAMPFFNYADKRFHYVQWVSGPKFVNVPSQYYNWSVAGPESVLAAGDKSVRVPLELTLHRDGNSYWRTQFRMERNSIVLAPHDFPVRSWWYGYHESLGTLKSYGQGAIHPYTDRRLLAFIQWAAQKWPVDVHKVIVSGSRGGASGSGALHLGLRHPEVFALVVSGHGSPTCNDLAASTDRKGLSDTAKGLQAAFGHPEWALKTGAGKSVWDELDMNKLLAGTPGSVELPLVAITSGNKGSIQEFHRVMLEQGRPIIAEFWWGGGRYIPVTATETFPNAIDLDVRKDLSTLAFNSPAAQKTLTGGMGEFNREFTWCTPVEEPARYEVTIRTSGRQNAATSKTALFDVTLRRLQKFKVEPGKTCHWTVTSTDSAVAQSGPPKKARSAKDEASLPTEGETIATKDGVLTLKGVPLGGEVKLTVTAK